MMPRGLIIVSLFALLAPSPARAQEHGERIIAVTRHVTRYQDRRAERRAEQRRESETERTSRTVQIGAEGEIDVSNISGDIVITRGSGTAATIEAVRTAWAATIDEARAMLALVTVDIAERGPRAEIRTRYPRDNEMRGRRNIRVDVAFNITAPPNTRIVAKSISGNVSVSDIVGGLSLDSVSGTVKIANAGRVAAAKSISGNVELLNSRVDGALSAGSISGVVKLQNVTAGSLALTSVSGNVSLQDVSCARIEAQTISGDVQFSGDLEPNGRYEFTSHSGSVRLAVGGKTGFQLEATSFSGSINSDLPLTLEGGQRRPRAVRGKFGNGSALLELTSFSGSISIGKR
jgi:DUF4097 and DUF4098 domain-containing protein YvlB